MNFLLFEIVRYCRRRALYLILLPLAAACGSDKDMDTLAQSSAACIDEGELTAELFGAIQTELSWRDDGIECHGMPRPHGKGARLRFAGASTSNGESLELAFIIALPGLEQGESASELPAGVTLIDEKAARFFSTPEPSSCWADIEHQLPLRTAEPAVEAEPEYRIEGLLYCMTPLAEVNGNGSVTLTDLRFRGRLDWRLPE